MRPATKAAAENLIRHGEGRRALVLYHLATASGLRIFCRTAPPDALLGTSGLVRFADGSWVADGSALAGEGSEVLDAIQECLLYVELNPVRAALVQRPEQWTRSSAYLRVLKKDDWLLALKELFPEAPSRQVYQHYRARLLYRGAVSEERGRKAIPEQILREEESQGFCRKGLSLRARAQR